MMASGLVTTKGFSGPRFAHCSGEGNPSLLAHTRPYPIILSREYVGSVCCYMTVTVRVTQLTDLDLL